MLNVNDVRVGSICRNGHDIHKVTRRDIANSAYVNFEPVLLTPYVLQNSGFAEVKYGYAFGKFKLIAVQTLNGLVYYHSNREKELRFVHELQNLFHSLEAKELTVVIKEHEFEIM